MKLIHEFGYSSGGRYEFKILTHGGLFYLELNGHRIARADNEKVLRSYIDGFIKGYESGYPDGITYKENKK